MHKVEALRGLVPEGIGVGLLVVSALAANALAVNALAAEPAEAPGARCVSIGDDRARLACYDEAHARKAAPVDATVAFGLTEQREREREDAAEESVAQISAKVEQVRVKPRDALVLTLDNGQVWQQTSNFGSLTLRAGDGVRIKRAALGSYLLYPPNGGSVRVRRLE